jgi:hypothetical protein
MKLFFPGPKETGGGHGVCTCKGMMAYNFNASGTHPWREVRQSAYSSTLYDTDPTNPASLHKCPQLNYHQAGDGKVLPSWDQLYFDARALPVEEEFFFHLELQLTDPESFGVTPQAASRRMQSTSSSSLFNLAIASSGTRALSERTLAGDYTSTGTGSFIVTSPLTGVSHEVETTGEIVSVWIFVLLLYFWFYPCTLQCSTTGRDTDPFTRIFRFGLLGGIGFFVFFASNLLWYYHITAGLSLISWVGVTCYYLHGTSHTRSEWDCTIDKPSLVFFMLAFWHISLAIIGSILVVTDLTVYGDGLTEGLQWLFTLIFVALCPLMFWVRSALVSQCHFKFSTACNDVQKDGVGCFPWLFCFPWLCCFESTQEDIKRIEWTDTPNTPDPIGLNNLFQCSVSDVMKTHPEDSDIKSYGIVRRKSSRFKF